MTQTEEIYTELAENEETRQRMEQREREERWARERVEVRESVWEGGEEIGGMQEIDRGRERMNE